MAYSAPELLLVGAAQNLVLGGSLAKDHASCERFAEQEESSSFYDITGLW